ncbi:MAG: hypothetical protein ACYDAD_11445 [Acidimicrobiales bacterium]
MLLDVLTFAVLAYIGSRLVLAARQSLRAGARTRTVEVLAGLRTHHFLLALPVLAGVLALAVALFRVPGLDFGWWTAIGGQGNPVVGSTRRTTGTPLAVVVPAVFLVLLVPGLPLLVEREERLFRLGSEGRSRPRQVVRGAVFGLVHAVVGIPIGAALALSVGGWYLTWAYLRGWRAGGGSAEAGLLESTRSHLAYNLTILVVVGAALAAGAR